MDAQAGPVHLLGQSSRPVMRMRPIKNVCLRGNGAADNGMSADLHKKPADTDKGINAHVYASHVQQQPGQLTSLHGIACFVRAL
jgi:hypothetical protein